MKHPSLQIIREEHGAMTAVLHSLAMLVERGPEDEPVGFFDALRAMLFYIDEFPERLHHAKESELLFPKVARVAPELVPVIRQLDADHMNGVSEVRRLQYLLLGWELIGEGRHAVLTHGVRDYVRFYLEHMRIEETQLLPVAEKLFTPADWEELDAAFLSSRDPLAGGPHDSTYDRLFSVIATTAPASVASLIEHAMPHRARPAAIEGNDAV